MKYLKRFNESESKYSRKELEEILELEYESEDFEVEIDSHLFSRLIVIDSVKVVLKPIITIEQIYPEGSEIDNLLMEWRNVMSGYKPREDGPIGDWIDDDGDDEVQRDFYEELRGKVRDINNKILDRIELKYDFKFTPLTTSNIEAYYGITATKKIYVRINYSHNIK